MKIVYISGIPALTAALAGIVLFGAPFVATTYAEAISQRCCVYKTDIPVYDVSRVQVCWNSQNEPKSLKLWRENEVPNAKPVPETREVVYSRALRAAYGAETLQLIGAPSGKIASDNIVVVNLLGEGNTLELSLHETGKNDLLKLKSCRPLD